MPLGLTSDEIAKHSKAISDQLNQIAQSKGWTKPGQYLTVEEFQEQGIKNKWPVDERAGTLIREYEWLKNKPQAHGTYGSEYTLPGGRDYRETIFRSLGPTKYKEPHFGENVVGHVRTSTFDVPGGKARVAHEVQSTLHQQASKWGYRPADMTWDEAKMKHGKAEERLFEKLDEVGQYLDQYAPEDTDEGILLTFPLSSEWIP